MLGEDLGNLLFGNTSSLVVFCSILLDRCPEIDLG